MARRGATLLLNDLRGGFVTEETAIATSPNVVRDIANWLPVNRKPEFSPRLGLDFEDSYVSLTAPKGQNNFQSHSLGSYVWEAVNKQADFSLVVAQLGNELHFFVANDGAVSAEKLTYELPLNDHRARGFEGDVKKKKVAFASSALTGDLYVVGESIEPLAVSYDIDTDTFTVTELDIEIRDFKELGTMIPSDQLVELTDANVTLHKYDLRNRGWIPFERPGFPELDPMEFFVAGGGGSGGIGKYPPKSKPWWVAKTVGGSLGVGAPARRQFQTIHAGTSDAASGHYIINAFYKDRSLVSGIEGLDVEVLPGRPTTTKFYAGRVWYGGHKGGEILYSQIVNETPDAGKCYQRNDPTSEEASDLLDNDGGVVNIPELKGIVAFATAGPALLVLASNGVWSISGPNGGDFRSTDFQINKVSTFGCISRDSVVEVGDAVFYCSEKGIHAIAPPQTGVGLQEQSVTDDKIASFYRDLPLTSRKHMEGVYVPDQAQIHWLYSTADQGTEYLHRKDAILTLHLDLGAWFKQPIKARNGSNLPYIHSAFVLPDTTTPVDTTDYVVDNDGVQVVDSGGTEVVTGNSVLGNPVIGTNRLMFLVNEYDYDYTFAEFNNTDRYDWATDATNASTTPNYIDCYAYGAFYTGQDMRIKKQVNHVYVFMKALDGSSLKLKVGYDWNSSGKKLGSEKECYRVVRDFDGEVVRTKHLVRGSGLSAIQFRLYVEDGSDFIFQGIQTEMLADVQRS